MRIANNIYKCFAVSIALIIVVIGGNTCSSQPTQVDTPLGAVHYVKPKGVYATIDTRQAIQLGRMLAGNDATARQQASEMILANPEKFPPVVFYALSKALMDEGKKDDAVFWFCVGQLRCRYDARLCTDASARSGIGALDMQYGPYIYPYIREIHSKLLNIINKVAEWDERTPYDYDHRWLNLHGLSAISLTGEEPKITKPLSIPENEWGKVRVDNRIQFVAMYKKLVDELEKKEKDLATPEVGSKYFKQAGSLNYEYAPGIILPLRNGKILCLGGRQYNYRQPEKFVQAADGQRYGHTEGMVELFDPNSEQSTVIGKLPFLFEQDTMRTPYHCARGLELKDGRIFITGRFIDQRPESEWTHKGELHKPETWIQRLPIVDKRNEKLVSITPHTEHNMFGLIYNYKNNSIEIVKSPDNIPPRYMTTMSLLPDGKVLIVGGAISPEEAYSWMRFPETRVLTYDPNSKSLKVVGNLQHARYGHRMMPLNDSEFMLFGGYGLSPKQEVTYKANFEAYTKTDKAESEGLTHDVEIFNLRSGKSKIVGQILQPRHSFCIIQLPDREVFITGGAQSYRAEVGLSVSEVYSIERGASRYVGEAATNADKAVDKSAAPFKFVGGGGTSQSLLSGSSIVAVEGSSAYIYDSKALIKPQPLVTPAAQPLTKATFGKSILKDVDQRVFVLGGKFPDDPTEYAHWQKNGSPIVEFVAAGKP